MKHARTVLGNPVDPAERFLKGSGFRGQSGRREGRHFLRLCLCTRSKRSPPAQSQFHPQPPDRAPRRRPSPEPQLRTRHPGGGGKLGPGPLWLSTVTSRTNTARAPKNQPIPISHANKVYGCPIRAVFILASRSSPGYLDLCKTFVEWRRRLAGGETRTN